jgi:hypothetical protein
MTKRPLHVTPRRPTASGQQLQAEPPLSPQLGFVVQFRVRTGQPATYFAGRVEHLASGRAAYFRSLDDLTAHFTRALTEEDSADT